MDCTRYVCLVCWVMWGRVVYKRKEGSNEEGRCDARVHYVMQDGITPRTSARTAHIPHHTHPLLYAICKAICYTNAHQNSSQCPCCSTLSVYTLYTKPSTKLLPIKERKKVVHMLKLNFCPSFESSECNEGCPEYGHCTAVATTCNGECSKCSNTSCDNA